MKEILDQLTDLGKWDPLGKSGHPKHKPAGEELSITYAPLGATGL